MTKAVTKNTSLKTYADYQRVITRVETYNGAKPLRKGDVINRDDIGVTVYVDGKPGRKLRRGDTVSTKAATWTYVSKKDLAKGTVSTYAQVDDIVEKAQLKAVKSDVEKKLNAIVNRFMAGEITDIEMAQETIAVKMQAASL